MQGHYWHFYWPLALTGVSLLLARQFQNGILARYPDATRELAIFALASSVFFLFDAAQVFLRQMVNVLARSRGGYTVVHRFTILLSCLLTVPFVLIGFTASGRHLLALAYDIKGDTLNEVARYIQYLAPLIIVNGLRQFYTGLLIQAKRTRLVTILNLQFLAGVVLILLLGYRQHWSPVTTLATAQVVSSFLHLILSYATVARWYVLPSEPRHERLTYRHTLYYFWPASLTSIMFALSRPILYSFVNRVPDAEPQIAALRVAFDFAMIFHIPLNQFRDLFVTFGYSDLRGVRRFTFKVMAVIVIIMLLTACTPLGGLFLGRILNIQGEVLSMARQIILVLCALPLIVTVRNYFHGIALLQHRTGSMAAGGILRISTIYFGSLLLYSLGVLNGVSAAALLVAGFAMETIIVIFSMRWGKVSMNPSSDQKH